MVMAFPFRQFFRFSTPIYKKTNTFFTSTVLKKVYLDEKNKAFVLKLDEGIAHVSYIRMNGVIDLKHTYVPEIFRGKGVAIALAEGVLDYCLQNNLKVKISCWYLQKFYKANEQKYESIVT